MSSSPALVERAEPQPARRLDRPARRPVSGRDPAVDLARAGCLVVVVLLHALMVGVGIGESGPVLQNAMEGWPGFAPLSWIVQVMPLFFLLGGFSAHTQWERMRRRGAGYGDYLAGRVRRLLVPASAALVAVAVLLSALAIAGVPASLVAIAGFRISQPLWFLGVYILCTAAVPPLVALHRRAPVVGLLTPAAVAVAVDVARGATGVTAIGFANLLFVWLTVQQLGFWLASGRLAGVSRRRLAVVGVAALGLLLLLCANGVWSFDMLANLNPPTCALLLLAVAQLSVLHLAAPTLRRWARLPGPSRFVAVVSARSMTVYLWHMPVLIVLAGGLLVGALVVPGLRLPAPLSGDWWLTRPLWFAAVLVAVAAVVAAAGRFETGRPGGSGATAAPTVRSGRAAVVATAAAATGAAAVLVALLGGASIAAWVAASALAFLALRILGRSVLPAAVTR
ncbi:acyltransferase family protein [Leifsonia aquatica]|uniref:acyltransferase family protein n=1 Tax=Leifsonia aquatica TaxID=144185 RepID=UPI00046AF20A|nr:acyltransferase [Leifsonia aquatica]